MVTINTRLDKELLDKFDMLCARDKRSRAFKMLQSVEHFIRKYESEHGEIAIDQVLLGDFRKRYHRRNNY